MQKKSIWLAVIGGLLLLGVVAGWLYKLGSGASDRLYNQVLAPETNTNSDSSSGDMMSGEILSGDILSWTTLTGSTTSGTILTGDTTPEYVATSGSTSETPTTDTFAPETPEVAAEPTYTTVLPAQGTLNYSQVIPYLVEKYNLKNTSGKTFTFTNVSKSNVLYAPFNTAATKAMIGEGINPISKVSCNTYLVLKGIAANWSVSYTGAPQAAYRAKANDLGQVNGCTDGAFVTKSTL